MSRIVATRFDRALDSAVKKFAAENDFTQSQAVRELLRQALKNPPDPVSRGWKEGFAQGYRDSQLQIAGRSPSSDWLKRARK